MRYSVIHSSTKGSIYLTRLPVHILDRGRHAGPDFDHPGRSASPVDPGGFGRDISPDSRKRFAPVDPGTGPVQAVVVTRNSLGTRPRRR